MNTDCYPPPPVSRRLSDPSPGAFLLCSIWTSPTQWNWQEALYRWAFNEARAVASP